MSRELDGPGQVLFPPGFGNVGFNRVINETGHPVIERTLDTSDFQVFPMKGTYFPWKAGANGTWQAACPGNEVPSRNAKWGTLYDLAIRVRSRRPLKSDDKDLKLLRQLLVGLLRAVQSVHQQTPDNSPGRLGLLDPTNVLYYITSSGEPLVLLPDAGFRWEGWLDTPRHLMESRWAGKPKECEIFRKLWGNQPLVDAQRAATKASETVALARLLGWVISGEILLAAPARYAEGASKAEISAWKSLAPFLNDSDKNFGTQDLAQAYKVAPVWACFAEQASVLKASKSRQIWTVLVSLLLCALLGVIVTFHKQVGDWIVSLIPQPPVKNQVCPECGENDPYFPILNEISGKDGAFQSLNAVLTNGAIGDSIYLAWVPSDKLPAAGEAGRVRTEHFEKMYTWIAIEMSVLQRLKALETEETAERKACRQRLVTQLRTALENTFRVIAGTVEGQRSSVDSDERFRKLAEEFMQLAPELKLEKPWPKYNY